MTPLPKNRAPWPHEDKLQLIKLVQPHEMIWRAGQKNFTELGERKAALEEVANAFDGRYTIEDIGAQWRNLKDVFYKRHEDFEARKTLEGNASPPQWQYYEPMMRFMLQHIDTRNEIVMKRRYLNEIRTSLEANNGGNLDETQFFDTVSQQGEDDGQVLVNFFDKGEDQLDEEGVDGQQLGDDENVEDNEMGDDNEHEEQRVDPKEGENDGDGHDGVIEIHKNEVAGGYVDLTLNDSTIGQCLHKDSEEVDPNESVEVEENDDDEDEKITIVHEDEFTQTQKGSYPSSSSSRYINEGLKTQHGRIYHQQQNNSGLNQTFTVGDNNNVGHQNQRNNGADNFVHHLNAVNTQKMRPFDPQACSTPTRFLSPQTSNTTNLNLNNKRPFPIGTSGDKNASGGGMFAVPTNPPVKRGRGRPPHLLPNGERARQAVKRIKLNQSFAFGSTFVKNNQQQGMKTEEMRVPTHLGQQNPPPSIKYLAPPPPPNLTMSRQHQLNLSLQANHQLRRSLGPRPLTLRMSPQQIAQIQQLETAAAAASGGGGRDAGREFLFRATTQPHQQQQHGHPNNNNNSGRRLDHHPNHQTSNSKSIPSASGSNALDSFSSPPSSYSSAAVNDRFKYFGNFVESAVRDLHQHSPEVARSLLKTIYESISEHQKTAADAQT